MLWPHHMLLLVHYPGLPNPKPASPILFPPHFTLPSRRFDSSPSTDFLSSVYTVLLVPPNSLHPDSVPTSTNPSCTATSSLPYRNFSNNSDCSTILLHPLLLLSGHHGLGSQACTALANKDSSFSYTCLPALTGPSPSSCHSLRL